MWRNIRWEGKDLTSVVITNLNDLIKEIGNRKVYIYGAKTVAVKLYYHLVDDGIDVEDFQIDIL